MLQVNFSEALQYYKNSDFEKDMVVSVKEEEFNIGQTAMLKIPKQKKSINKNTKDISNSKLVVSKNISLKEKVDNKDILHCILCNKSFCDIVRLKTHKEAAHVKQSKLICAECGFVPKKRQGLKGHQEAVHEKVKTKCPDCDFMGYGIVGHKRMQHGDPRFVCHDCGYKTSYKQNFTCHTL